uniref:Uncharacterized protein n=1 Tax=Trichogramma kaykai TaxID=54128 RepID=A0ABD2WCE0_9HYME
MLRSRIETEIIIATVAITCQATVETVPACVGESEKIESVSKAVTAEPPQKVTVDQKAEAKPKVADKSEAAKMEPEQEKMCRACSIVAEELANCCQSDHDCNNAPQPSQPPPTSTTDAASQSVPSKTQTVDKNVDCKPPQNEKGTDCKKDPPCPPPKPGCISATCPKKVEKVDQCTGAATAVAAAVPKADVPCKSTLLETNQKCAQTAAAKSNKTLESNKCPEMLIPPLFGRQSQKYVTPSKENNKKQNETKAKCSNQSEGQPGNTEEKQLKKAINSRSDDAMNAKGIGKKSIKPNNKCSTNKSPRCASPRCLPPKIMKNACGGIKQVKTSSSASNFISRCKDSPRKESPQRPKSVIKPSSAKAQSPVKCSEKIKKPVVISRPSSPRAPSPAKCPPKPVCKPVAKPSKLIESCCPPAPPPYRAHLCPEKKAPAPKAPAPPKADPACICELLTKIISFRIHWPFTMNHTNSSKESKRDHYKNIKARRRL